MIPERYRNICSEIWGKFPIGNFGKLPRPIPTDGRRKQQISQAEEISTLIHQCFSYIEIVWFALYRKTLQFIKLDFCEEVREKVFIIFTLLLRESSPNKFHRETQQPEAKKYSLNSSVDILHHLHHSTSWIKHALYLISLN